MFCCTMAQKTYSAAEAVSRKRADALWDSVHVEECKDTEAGESTMSENQTEMTGARVGFALGLTCDGSKFGRHHCPSRPATGKMLVLSCGSSSFT
jgi:hypothetical protein